MNRSLALVLPLVLAACPGTQEKVAAAALAEGCFLNTDCASPLVCAFKRCHNACTQERDCPPGLSCVASDRPFKVCLLPQEATCVYNTDCPPSLVCAVDLRCHAECLENRDCVSGQLCVQGTCANPVQVSDAGMLIAAAMDGGPTATPRCAYSSDCAGDLICIGGACLPQCREDRDCRAGEACELPRAVCHVVGQDTPDGGGLPSGTGRACLLNSDCPKDEICGGNGRCRYACVEARDCGPGDCCYDHACRPQSFCGHLLPDGGLPLFDGGTFDGGGPGYCLNDLGCGDDDFCNGTELCVNNRCQLADHPSCEDFNPCTIDMCNAVARTCAYASTGLDAGDDDKDGHFAVKCGGSSDDCDDTNPEVYFGHPETCDFVDNNCNGAVDEGLWHERSGARISLNGTQRYPWWAGKPSVVRTDAGFIAVVASDTIDGALEAYQLDGQLGLIQGPVELFRSATQWVNPAATPTLYGRRMLRPTIAINPAGEVLASAWLAEAPGTTTCTNTPWQVRTSVASTSRQLTGTVRWEDVDADAAGPFCPNTVNPEIAFPRISGATLAWSPAAARWIAVWGTYSSGNSKDMQAGYFDADGGVPVRHPLLSAPDENRHYTIYSGPLEPPDIAVGANNVFVGIHGYTNNEPQFFLMDPTLSSRITPVQEIYQVGAQILAVGTAPQGYFLVTRYGTVTRLRFVSAVTGLPIGGPWTLEPGTFSSPNSTYGYDTMDRLAIVPIRDAFVYAEQDWPNASFGLISSANDGGYVKLKLNLPATPRSGFTLAPIDDRTVGLLWSDGQLKRTILECGP